MVSHLSIWVSSYQTIFLQVHCVLKTLAILFIEHLEYQNQLQAEDRFPT